MDKFDEAYRSTVGTDGEAESSAVRPLLRDVFVPATNEMVNLHSLRAALDALATFLVSPKGRTQMHFDIVDCFFTDVDNHWLPFATHVPSSYHRVFGMFLELHGTLTLPRSHASPEEILAAVQRLDVSEPNSTVPAAAAKGPPRG